MKTVITLLSFLIAMSIGSISYASSATEQTILDEHVTTTPIRVPVISTEEFDYSIYFDDDC